MTIYDFRRYLKLLNLAEERPSVRALEKIVYEHMVRVPFENISKLLRWKRTNRHEIPNLTQYLDGIEQHHFGGTCYTNNHYINQLLAHLGYDVRLCGADMNRPDVHLVNLVRVDGREFLVDVGYAAPFLRPLPRDLSEDFEVTHGANRYLLKPQDAEGRSRLELYRDGILRHGYVAKPTARHIEEFDLVIADSFRPNGTFMNAILIVRFDTARSWVIHNMEYIETHNDLSRRSAFETADELIEGIHDLFGMPPELVRIALDCFSFNGNAWG